MKRCIFSPFARTDLREIHDYLAARDADAALDLITRLQLACENLAKTPEIGRKRDDLMKSLRNFPVGHYIIFYRLLQEDVEIVRILHGRQNIESIFSE
jgi:toxin ParE1/3/4